MTGLDSYYHVICLIIKEQIEQEKTASQVLMDLPLSNDLDNSCYSGILKLLINMAKSNPILLNNIISDEFNDVESITKLANIFQTTPLNLTKHLMTIAAMNSNGDLFMRLKGISIEVYHNIMTDLYMVINSAKLTNEDPLLMVKKLLMRHTTLSQRNKLSIIRDVLELRNGKT